MANKDEKKESGGIRAFLRNLVGLPLPDEAKIESKKSAISNEKNVRGNNVNVPMGVTSEQVRIEKIEALKPNATVVDMEEYIVKVVSIILEKKANVRLEFTDEKNRDLVAKACEEIGIKISGIMSTEQGGFRLARTAMTKSSEEIEYMSDDKINELKANLINNLKQGFNISVTPTSAENVKPVVRTGLSHELIAVLPPRKVKNISDILASQLLVEFAFIANQMILGNRKITFSNKEDRDKVKKICSELGINTEIKSDNTLKVTNLNHGEASKKSLDELTKGEKFSLANSLSEKLNEVYKAELGLGSRSAPTLWAQELKQKHLDMLTKVNAAEIEGARWDKKDAHQQCPNIMAIIDDYNKIGLQVRDEILLARTPVQQQEAYLFFVQLMKASSEIGDFHTAHAIYSTLKVNPNISRLEHFLKSTETSKIMREHDYLFSTSDNQTNLRKDTAAKSDKGTVVPLLSLTTQKILTAEGIRVPDQEGDERNQALENVKDRKEAAVKEFVAYQNKANEMKSIISLSVESSDASSWPPPIQLNIKDAESISDLIKPRGADAKYWGDGAAINKRQDEAIHLNRTANVSVNLQQTPITPVQPTNNEPKNSAELQKVAVSKTEVPSIHEETLEQVKIERAKAYEELHEYENYIEFLNEKPEDERLYNHNENLANATKDLKKLNEKILALDSKVDTLRAASQQTPETQKPSESQKVATSKVEKKEFNIDKPPQVGNPTNKIVTNPENKVTTTAVVKPAVEKKEENLYFANIKAELKKIKESGNPEKAKTIKGLIEVLITSGIPIDPSSPTYEEDKKQAIILCQSLFVNRSPTIINDIIKEIDSQLDINKDPDKQKEVSDRSEFLFEALMKLDLSDAFKEKVGLTARNESLTALFPERLKEQLKAQVAPPKIVEKNKAVTDIKSMSEENLKELMQKAIKGKTGEEEVQPMALNISTLFAGSLADIKQDEFYKLGWSKKDKDDTSKNIGKLTALATSVSDNLIATSILDGSKSKKEVIEKSKFWINVLQDLMDNKNFDAAMSVRAGLTKAAVYNIVNKDPEVKALLEPFDKFFIPKNRFEEMRKEYASLEENKKEYISYFGQVLSDLTFSYEGIPDTTDDDSLLSLHKLNLLSNQLSDQSKFMLTARKMVSNNSPSNLSDLLAGKNLQADEEQFDMIEVGISLNKGITLQSLKHTLDGNKDKINWIIAEQRNSNNGVKQLVQFIDEKLKEVNNPKGLEAEKAIARKIIKAVKVHAKQSNNELNDETIQAIKDLKDKHGLKKTTIDKGLEAVPKVTRRVTHANIFKRKKSVSTEPSSLSIQNAIIQAPVIEQTLNKAEKAYDSSKNFDPEVVNEVKQDVAAAMEIKVASFTADKGKDIKSFFDEVLKEVETHPQGKEVTLVFENKGNLELFRSRIDKFKISVELDEKNKSIDFKWDPTKKEAFLNAIEEKSKELTTQERKVWGEVSDVQKNLLVDSLSFYTDLIGRFDFEKYTLPGTVSDESRKILIENLIKQGKITTNEANDIDINKIYTLSGLKDLETYLRVEPKVAKKLEEMNKLMKELKKGADEINDLYQGCSTNADFRRVMQSEEYKEAFEKYVGGVEKATFLKFKLDASGFNQIASKINQPMPYDLESMLLKPFQLLLKEPLFYRELREASFADADHYNVMAEKFKNIDLKIADINEKQKETESKNKNTVEDVLSSLNNIDKNNVAAAYEILSKVLINKDIITDVNKKSKEDKKFEKEFNGKLQEVSNIVFKHLKENPQDREKYSVPSTNIAFKNALHFEVNVYMYNHGASDPIDAIQGVKFKKLSKDEKEGLTLIGDVVSAFVNPKECISFSKPNLKLNELRNDSISNLIKKIDKIKDPNEAYDTLLTILTTLEKTAVEKILKDEKKSEKLIKLKETALKATETEAMIPSSSKRLLDNLKFLDLNSVKVKVPTSDTKNKDLEVLSVGEYFKKTQEQQLQIEAQLGLVDSQLKINLINKISNSEPGKNDFNKQVTKTLLQELIQINLRTQLDSKQKIDITSVASELSNRFDKDILKHEINELKDNISSDAENKNDLAQGTSPKEKNQENRVKRRKTFGETLDAINPLKSKRRESSEPEISTRDSYVFPVVVPDVSAMPRIPIKPASGSSKEEIAKWASIVVDYYFQTGTQLPPMIEVKRKVDIDNEQLLKLLVEAMAILKENGTKINIPEKSEFLQQLYTLNLSQSKDVQMQINIANILNSTTPNFNANQQNDSQNPTQEPKNEAVTRAPETTRSSPKPLPKRLVVPPPIESINKSMQQNKEIAQKIAAGVNASNSKPSTITNQKAQISLLQKAENAYNEYVVKNPFRKNDASNMAILSGIQNIQLKPTLTTTEEQKKQLLVKLLTDNPNSDAKSVKEFILGKLGNDLNALQKVENTQQSSTLQPQEPPTIVQPSNATSTWLGEESRPGHLNKEKVAKPYSTNNMEGRPQSMLPIHPNFPKLPSVPQEQIKSISPIPPILTTNFKRASVTQSEAFSVQGASPLDALRKHGHSENSDFTIVPPRGLFSNPNQVEFKSAAVTNANNAPVCVATFNKLDNGEGSTIYGLKPGTTGNFETDEKKKILEFLVEKAFNAHFATPGNKDKTLVINLLKDIPLDKQDNFVAIVAAETQRRINDGRLEFKKDDPLVKVGGLGPEGKVETIKVEPKMPALPKLPKK